MIGRFRQFLGIEGLKLELIIPEKIPAEEKAIRGTLRMYSIHAQDVTHVHIALIERYARGRGTDKLIDEYELAQISLDQPVHVPAKEVVEIDFTLPFTLVRSDAEEWGHRNWVFYGLSNLAKKIHQVQSIYRLEAQANVRGMALSPFDKVMVHFN